MDTAILLGLAFTTFLMGNMGLHLTLHPPLPEDITLKSRYKFGFVALGVLSVALILVQGVRSSAAQDHLVEVAESAVQATTGGTSIPFLYPVGKLVDDDGASLVAMAKGKYRIQNVSYQITAGRPPYNLSPRELNDTIAGRTDWFSIGDLNPKFGIIIRHLVYPRQDSGYYTINLAANNGEVVEKLEIRPTQSGQGWESKVVVFRDDKEVFKLDFGELPDFVWTKSLPVSRTMTFNK